MSLGVQVAYAAAEVAARLRSRDLIRKPLPAGQVQSGISVVIPSRNGRDLLAAQLPGILQDLTSTAEVLVIDNGSDDGTAEWLRRSFPQVRAEVWRDPLSFARAANYGVAAARYERICLLNNDMRIDPGFFQALDRAFCKIPGLFCATAQIRFPPGVRREETGKAVMARTHAEDFPLRCDDPLPGEDLTWVLYGSGGCSLYDAARLRELGGIDVTYEPAYVEDLDLGFRAWQRGWPSVYVAAARVEHRHRATTSRYYTPEQLDTILEINYLKFLARSIWSSPLFRRLWMEALTRLRSRSRWNVPARRAIREAAAIALAGGPATPPKFSEELVLGLTNGTVFVFPGRPATGKPRVLIAGPRLRASVREDRDSVLVALTETVTTPPADLLNACVEVVLVRRGPSEQAALRAAIQLVIQKWRPEHIELDRELDICGQDWVSFDTVSG